MGITVHVASTRKKRVIVRKKRASWQKFILTEIH